MGKFTDKGIKALAEPGRHRDGDGLYLYVAPGGAKSWVQRIVVNGRRRDIGLGSCPLVGLAKARELATENRSAVAEGRDPLAEKWRAKETARNPDRCAPTFEEAFAEFFDGYRRDLSNEKHIGQWQSTMRTYVFPAMGRETCDDITRSDVLTALEPIWSEKHETASRVRQRMETVLDWVIAKGYRTNTENPADKALLKVLPKVRREQKHHPALDYSKVGWAIARVHHSNSNLLTKLAFEFLVLTAARTDEVRSANWGEILWERRTWEISAAKMKARCPHRVPLSDRAMEILQELWPIAGPDGLIFPSRPGGGRASDMTYNEMMRRLGIPGVPHGFRSSFTDCTEERHPEYSHAVDAALAHQENNKKRKAYKRTDFFKPRTVLMQLWADYIANSEKPLDGKPG